MKTARHIGLCIIKCKDAICMLAYTGTQTKPIVDCWDISTSGRTGRTCVTLSQPPQVTPGPSRSRKRAGNKDCSGANLSIARHRTLADAAAAPSSVAICRLDCTDPGLWLAGTRLGPQLNASIFSMSAALRLDENKKADTDKKLSATSDLGHTN